MDDNEEDALSFVNRMIDDIIKKYKLDALSCVGNKQRPKRKKTKDNNSKSKNDSESKHETHDEEEQEETNDDDWEMDNEKYTKVAHDHCILLRKLLQIANDISIDSSLSKQKKFAVLQNIGFAISRIDNRINSSDSFVDVEKIFKMPIDNSIQVTSDLKKMVGSIDDKQLNK